MNKSKVLAWAMLVNLILITTPSTYGDRNKIVLAGDYWCPFNCGDQEKDKGYLIEAAERIFSIYGIEIEYKLMPWNEALEKARAGIIDGVVGASRDEKELIFPKYPFTYSTIGTFTKADNNWIFDELDSLNGKIVTLVVDYDLGNRLREYILRNYFTNPSSFVLENGAYATSNCIANILTGKAEIYLEDEAVVNDYLVNKNLTKEIKNVGKLKQKPIPIFIGFSSKQSRASTYVKMLEDGQKSLEATGDLKKLRAKYNVPKSEININF